MDKKLHPPLLKKDDLRIAKNYRGINLTSIAAKVYNALLAASNQKLRKFSKESKWFLEKPIHNITGSNNPANLRRSSCKKLEAFDFIHRDKIEQILLVNSLPKETVTAIMMLYKNTQVKVPSSVGDRLLWHCFWCSHMEYISPISVHNLPRQRTSNVDRSNKRKRFYSKKARSRRYPGQTNTDAKYSCYIVIYTNMAMCEMGEIGI